MKLFKSKFLKQLFTAFIFIMPTAAMAAPDIIDKLNIAPIVPIVLDAFMLVATGCYDFFVGKGTGIIYVLVWGFLAVSLATGILKMYFPKQWSSLFGISGGGDFYNGNVSGFGIIQNNVMKPVIRALVAAVILLQIRPVFVTEWLVNPFLQFGAIYTHAITETINGTGVGIEKIECPADVIRHGWISPSSCEFLIRPVADLSRANNQVVKRGFDFLTNGLRGLITLIPHGGQDFMSLVTGILLIITFIASNLFMALLIIQGIFNLGMALILYPFQVLTYVVKSSDKWFDVWPAFSGITKALQQLVITMIACAFILCINLAVIYALFQWNSQVFVVAANGMANSNVPTVANTPMGFGGHSIMWISAILTFYLMLRIFKLTRDQLNQYIGGDMTGLYNKSIGDTKKLWNNTKNWGGKIGNALGWGKK